MLNPWARQVIGDFFSSRPSFQPLSVVLASEQSEADKNCVFILERFARDDYYLRPKSKNTQTMPSLHGRFIYVIKEDRPGFVYCAKAFDPINQFLSDNNWSVEGHTSLTKRRNVLFAGDLLFSHRKLIAWSNASGHYQPSSELRHRNLLPHIKLLLPEDLYREVDFRRSSIASAGSVDSRLADLSSGDFGNYSGGQPGSSNRSVNRYS
ncbi:hypothetical protein [Dryocola sp. BD626]|uniref:hypothetical protein n=1 Tax=Dryocola sp. BD626 TaxID=3133273 RepID=UPI003F4F63BD